MFYGMKAKVIIIWKLEVIFSAIRSLTAVNQKLKTN
jgi:hypothetical protein